MSYRQTNILIHACFTTFDKAPLITTSLSNQLELFIANELHFMKHQLHSLQTQPDHLHMIYEQNPAISVSDTLRLVKGASSHYINQYDLTTNKFSWQIKYKAFAIGYDQLETEYNWLMRQTEIHEQMSFEEEVEYLIRRYHPQLPAR